MSLTIHLGWWLAPLVITLLAGVIAWRRAPEISTGIGGAADTLICTTYALVAALVSAIAWLAWALIA